MHSVRFESARACMQSTFPTTALHTDLEVLQNSSKSNSVSNYSHHPIVYYKKLGHTENKIKGWIFQGS